MCIRDRCSTEYLICNTAFEQMVVTVYTENQQMKDKINSLIAIIKDQNKKINDHREREDKLRQEN